MVDALGQVTIDCKTLSGWCRGPNHRQHYHHHPLVTQIPQAALARLYDLTYDTLFISSLNLNMHRRCGHEQCNAALALDDDALDLPCPGLLAIMQSSLGNHVGYDILRRRVCQSINQSILKSVWDLAQIHQTVSDFGLPDSKICIMHQTSLLSCACPTKGQTF